MKSIRHFKGEKNRKKSQTIVNWWNGEKTAKNCKLKSTVFIFLKVTFQREKEMKLS